MDATTAEILRLLQNLIRLGTVAAIDHATQRVRVSTGDLLTDWLPWSAVRAGTTRQWDPITVGEQVLILSPNGDFAAGIVFPAVYSNAHPSPSDSPDLHTRHYPDGAVIEYDHKAHALRATLPSGSSATVTADTVTSNAPETICTGNLTVHGNMDVIGVSHAKGTITCDQDVVASGISLTNHIHPESIGSQTGAPQ